MQDISAIALRSMQQDQIRLQAIANNVDNVRTVGYKREVSAARPFIDHLRAPGGNAVASQPVPEAGDLTVLSDMRPGTLQFTGQSLDLALAGEGLFEIQTANGLAYTRQGNFHLDARGRLITAQGDAVMGKRGEIVLQATTLTVDSAGNIFDAADTSAAFPRPVAQLRVVQADSVSSFRRLGGGLMAAESAVAPMADTTIQVRQGYVENSNVSSLQEMLQLMQVTRHFESMQRIAQGFDEMLGTAIRKLGDL